MRGAARPVLSTGDEERKLLKDLVGSLPSQAVEDLLSKKVCMRCIFGLFGIHRQAYLFSSLLPSLMRAILEESTHVEGSGAKENEDSSNASANKGLEVEPDICSLCLGILQFTYRNDKKMVVKEQGADEFTASIANLVQQEGHQMDSFSLEVSIPSSVQQTEQVVWSYVKGKYGSEHWLQGGLSELISTKDALKYAVANSLEALLGVKSGPSSYRICLTYTESQALSVAPNMTERNGGSKRRKTVSRGANNCVDTVNDDLVGSERASNLGDQEFATCFKFSKERVSEPCNLVFHCYRTPIYFGGRYLKFSRNVSQTCWIIDDERMGEASVEEIIGGNILPTCQGDSYKFHAAGREDIDVRMLGSGRPFLVEVQNARQVPCEASVKQIETNINDSDKKLVGVKNLKVVTNHGWTLMHEGESEKQKQYCALVWTSRPIEDEDLQSIASLKDMLAACGRCQENFTNPILYLWRFWAIILYQILQKTPIRVLHRRSPLERAKIIHWMKIERIAGSSHYFLLHLCTQAGTYIKEFVHGDLGRTNPSFGSILGCRAEILQLDVTSVKMDCFLSE